MGAQDPSEDDASERVRATPDDAEGADRVDVVWFPDDDDYIVVAAGNGDRAVRFHRLGKYGVGAIVALFGTLGVLVLHGFLRSQTGLEWPLSGVVVGAGVLLVLAYIRRRYDPETPPEVVARDVPVDEASDAYNFEG